MARIKAAVAWPNGKTYLFEGNTYRRYDSQTGLLEAAGIPIVPAWPGFRPSAPDAGFYYGFGKAYFFHGGEYVRYDLPADTVEAAYLPPNPPFQLAAWGLPWTDRIDAVMNWGNGKLYFFRDSQYLRYDVTLDRPDAGYPLPIDGNWPGIWTDRVDAAFYTGGEKAYFFRESEYRRFDITTNSVDETGNVSTLQLERVPAPIWKAARDLTLDEANLLLGFLIESGKLQLSPTQTPFSGSWLTGISSPRPATHVVVKPARINHEFGSLDFHSSTSATPQPVLDNVDQRMVIVLYRLARWLNGSEPTASVLRHLGIGHGVGPPNDCHNQGRALDLSGLDGTSLGSSFTRSVLTNWGNRPATGGSLRLDPTVDQLAHDLFRTVFCFGTFECECNGIGGGNTWPPKEIGDPGGFVVHPDYIDVPPQILRPSHQNHVHMQIGPTLI